MSSWSRRPCAYTIIYADKILTCVRSIITARKPSDSLPIDECATSVVCAERV